MAADGRRWADDGILVLLVRRFTPHSRLGCWRVAPTIFGGWKNPPHVFARLDEHGTDWLELRVNPDAFEEREEPVSEGRVYAVAVHGFVQSCRGTPDVHPSQPQPQPNPQPNPTPNPAALLGVICAPRHLRQIPNAPEVSRSHGQFARFHPVHMVEPTW